MDKQTFSRKELYAMVCSEPLLSLSKKFDISDIEVSYEERKKEREERERRWAEQEEKERIKIEYEKRKEKELNDFKKASAKAKRWHNSNILRNYLEAFKNAKSAEGTLPAEIDDWIKWAENKADWYDLFIEKNDSLLEDVDRDTLITNKSRFS